VVIDVHDHFTTVPAPLRQYREQMLKDSDPKPFDLNLISDQDIRDAVLPRQIQHMIDKKIDKLIFSPTAGGMGHPDGTAKHSLLWSKACNDMINRVCDLFPERFIKSCQLPQSPGNSPKDWIEELEFRVKEQGFVACNINPDIAGGSSFTPSPGNEWWYPLYEKLVELNIPGHWHVSNTHNPAFHINGTHYIAWHHASAFEMMWHNEKIWGAFPALKLIASHGGGSVALQYNRTRSLTTAANIDFEAAIRKFYWDLACYDKETIETLIRVIGPKNTLFATEMWGTANKVDPKTGKFFDDTLYIYQNMIGISQQDLYDILEGNARKIYTNAKFDV
jgi:4-oxalmesaconate hydratase